MYNTKVDILEQIEQCLRKDGCLEPGAKILVGFSGGADSLCLLHGLARLGWPVVAAHFDHALRPESAKEARQAAEMAAGLGVPFVAERGDVQEYAQEHALSIEEAARMLRYRFLFAQAHARGAAAVAVAHHADDQVETVLMHLLRGAGLSGLKGMTTRAVLPEWDPVIPVVRPLLGVWRSEIDAYCQENGLSPIHDASNSDTVYFRNRLRHELIPLLEEYNPNFRQLLWRTADTLGADYESLNQLVDEGWKDCVHEVGKGYVTLRLLPLREQSEGIRRSLLRRAIAVLRPALRDIDYEAVQRAQEFALQPSRSGQADLLDGLTLLVEQDLLYVMEDGAQLPYPWPRLEVSSLEVLQIPGEVMIKDGKVIRGEFGEPMIPGRDVWQAALDTERLVFPLQVRVARPGERWQPLGMFEGTIKLSEFWINSGLPKRARKGWPVVFSGAQVVWVPGFRPAHFCRVTEKTQQIVLLRLISGN